MTLKHIIPVLALLLTGCAQSFYGSGRKLVQQGEYERAIDSFYKEIAANPDNAAAWRELGVAYYKMGECDKADDALKQANTINPDARTHLFFGLIYERQEQFDKAIDAYTASLNLNPSGQTRDRVTAHLDQLVYRKMTREVTFAVENESAIETDTIPENTLAVVNFDGSHLGSDLAPLAVGMAEFTASDLAKVNSLNIVERLKIDVIMNELKLSQTGYVDPASAPRMGKLLGTRKLITGSLLGIGDDGFRLDGVIVNTDDTASLFTESSEGKLSEIFDVQKQFVFDILDSLGVDLSVAERDAIKEVPTESYLAMLAYSRGRYYQQQGMNDMARQEFQTAISYDAGFSAAQSQLSKSVAAAAGGYSQSYQTLETYAVSGDADLETLASGLDSRLVGVILNSGVIPDALANSLAKSQPQVSETGRVVITVDVDNE